MSISTSNTIKLLRALSGQENTYTIPKLYVRLTECHVRALVLNQLVFYSDKSTRHDDDWFDKDYEEWEAETFVKERTLRNILSEFKKKRWCESRTIKVKGKRKLLCRPLLENILSDINKMLEKDPLKPKVKTCPNRKILPDSQPENFAVSILYTDKTTDKTTTSKPTPRPENPDTAEILSSSSFTPKDIKEILDLKLDSDERSNETFLEHCQHHVDNPGVKMKDCTPRERISGLKNILADENRDGRHFKAKRFVSNAEKQQKEEAKREEALRKAYNEEMRTYLHCRDFLNVPTDKLKDPGRYEEWKNTQD